MNHRRIVAAVATALGSAGALASLVFGLGQLWPALASLSVLLVALAASRDPNP